MILKNLPYFLTHLIVLYSGSSNSSPLVGENVEPAGENEFPFFVVLSSSSDITKKDDYFCGGTLITKKHVVTAEHCLDENVSNITFIVNAAKTYKAESWLRYDDWAKNQNILLDESINDIAVITLSDNVTDVVPAVISSLKHKSVVGKTVVTVGWGAINETAELYPDSLMKVSMKILDFKEFKRNSIAIFGRPVKYCFNFYYTSANPTVSLGCGDSGGPLMLESSKELIGVNISVCNSKVPVINSPLMSRHMILNYYRSFIEDSIKE